MNTALPPVGTETVAQRIQVIRGQRIMIDADLAALYGVTTKRFNEQVRRNSDRFPTDFMFQLTDQELGNLRSQFATSSSAIAWGGRRYLPYAFTEHGALMAATVLNSPRAIEMSVFIVRAFVQLREMLSAHKEVAAKLAALERKVSGHDRDIAGLIDAIRQLMTPPTHKGRSIGFIADIDKAKT